jgi:hypothetical protein
MNTITDDELLKIYDNTYLECTASDAIRFAHAVLVLSEQKQAAALADLRRWKSTNAPRIEALQGLLETAQRELIQQLREAAMHGHAYMGACPDAVHDWTARDPQCPACQAIEAADAALKDTK